jgi:hypothetical protein
VVAEQVVEVLQAEPAVMVGEAMAELPLMPTKGLMERQTLAVAAVERQVETTQAATAVAAS